MSETALGGLIFVSTLRYHVVAAPILHSVISPMAYLSGCKICGPNSDHGCLCSSHPLTGEVYHLRWEEGIDRGRHMGALARLASLASGFLPPVS